MAYKSLCMPIKVKLQHDLEKLTWNVLKVFFTKSEIPFQQMAKWHFVTFLSLCSQVTPEMLCIDEKMINKLISDVIYNGIYP